MIKHKMMHQQRFPGTEKCNKSNKTLSKDLIHEDAGGKTCSLTRQNRINQLDK